MNTLEETKDVETIKKMGINFAVIIGVLAALVIVSYYFAANLSS